MSNLGQLKDDCGGESNSGINLAIGVIPRRVRVASVLFVILFCSAYLTAFSRAVLAARRGYPPRTVYLVLLFVVIVIAIGGLILIVRKSGLPFLPLLHQYRYVIGALVIVLTTLFNISGSSLAMWSAIIGGDSFQGTLWGIPRSIRSDEFVVFTPFAFSQAYTGYAPLSDVIRGLPTDVTMLYAQPSWALATLFRPFLWGFMLFGSQHGLAFFWSARLVVLLLVSYEFGRWLTGDRKSISVAYAIFIGFAPIVQWWFSVNGTAELFIFGQALVVLYYRYLNAKNVRLAWAYGASIAYCCGGFALVLYPAWQVPLFYVFAALGIAVTYRFVSSFRKQHKSFVTVKAVIVRYVSPLAIPLLVLVVLLLIIVSSSKETISTVMHTAYPGARVEHGGGLAWNLFNYMQSIFGSLTPDSVLPNVCEQAVFLSLFPLGIILAIWVTVKQRDSVIVALLATDVILYTFGLVGFPTLLAKTTMLSNVTVGRLQMATTLIDVLLLFRSIVLINERNDRYNTKRISYLSAVLLSVLLSCVVIAGSTIASGYPIRAEILVAMGVLMSGCFFFVFMSIHYVEKASVYVGLLASIVLVAGVCVNPVQYGSAALTDNSTISQVKQRIGNPDIAVLATDSSFVGQAFIANGVPTITSVNSVPALDRWKKIDPQGKYQTIYNRYAYIGFDIKSEGAASFELNQPDSITVHLTVSDLETIGVTHLLTKQTISHRDLVHEGQIGEYHLYALHR